MRRVVYFTTLSETGRTAPGRVDAIRRGLAQQGWIVGQNVELTTRWLSAEVDSASFVAREIVALAPDVIIPAGTPATRATIEATSAIPIVFTMVSDPVGDGFVSNLARPEANVTGFINFEPEMGGKWLGLLKELRPTLDRVGVIANPDVAPGGGQLYLSSVQPGASPIGVSVVDLPVRTHDDINAAVATLAGDPNAGLISPPDSYLSPERSTLIAAAAEYRVRDTLRQSCSPPQEGVQTLRFVREWRDTAMKLPHTEQSSWNPRRAAT